MSPEEESPEGLVHPRRLIDIPRRFSEDIELDMTEAIIINRELAILSLRSRYDYKGQRNDYTKNSLLFFCNGDKSIIFSRSDEEVFHPVFIKEGIRKVPIRIRPTRHGRDKPTRIYVNEEMRFDCWIVDLVRGEIGINISSTDPFVVEGAGRNQDLVDILNQFQEEPSLYGLDELEKKESK